MEQHLQERIDSLTITRTLDTLHHRYGAAQQKLASELRPVDAELPSLPALPPSPTLSQLPTTLPDRLPASQALERVQLFKTKASQYTQQLRGQMQQGMQAIQNAPSALEQQAVQASGLDMLEQPPTSALGGSLSDGAGQLAAATATPDQIQQQMKQRLAQEAKQHFARHSDALADGQQQLSKLKRKYKAVQTEQDKFERATSLRGEPWTARLLLGSYFQFYGAAIRREPRFQADLSPFVGYRFNTRWSVGVGGSCRVPSSVSIYQGRVFVEGEVHRGFAAHVAYERSGLSSPVLSRGEDRAIVDQHLLVGIGKSYRITRNIRGTTLLLYRPGDIDRSLQLSRWNLRTGFLLSR